MADAPKDAKKIIVPETPKEAVKEKKSKKASEEPKAKEIVKKETVSKEEHDKVVNDLEAMKGRFKKYSKIDKIAEALEDDDDSEKEDPVEKLLKRMDVLEKGNRDKELEIAKRDFVSELDAPDEIKEAIQDVVPAGKDFNEKAQNMAKRLMNLQQPEQTARRRPAPFKAPDENRPPAGATANEILKWKKDKK